MTLLVGDATEYAGQNGASDDGAIDGHVVVRRFAAAATGTITSLSAFVCGSSDYLSLDIVVYADSAGTPGALLGYGTAPNPSLGEHDSAWVSTGAVSIAVVNGTDYWIGFVPHGGSVQCNDDGSGTASYWLTSSTFDPPPNPWPGGFNPSGSDESYPGVRGLSAGAALLLGDDTENPAPFGQTTGVSDGFAEAYRYVADESGIVTSLSAWVKSTSDYTTLDILVYGGGSEPGVLLGSGTAPPPVGDSWVTATVEIPVTGGSTYWLALQPHGGDVNFNVGTDSSYLGWDSNSSSASPLDPFGAEEGFDITGYLPAIRGLGASGSDAPPGLEFHVTGLWYPDAESVTYYGRIADPADGSNVTIPLDDSRLGEVTLSIFDPVVGDLVHHAYARMLKAYYNDDLVYWGVVKLNEIDFSAGTVKLNAVDPSIRAIRHYLRRGDIDGDLSAPHDDKSAVTIDGDGFRLLLDAARNIPEQTVRGCPDIGIDVGTDGSTLRADHLIGVSRGQEVWDSILALTQSSLGPDFNLSPTEDIPGSYCELVTDDRIGADRTTEVQLHYNTGFNNLDDLSFTEGSEYVTHAHVLSSDGRRVSAVNVEASAETGQYTWWEATEFSAQDLDPDKLDEALAAVGEAIIDNFGRPLVVVTLTLPLETEGGYLYGRDYDVGDTISVAGKKGYVTLEEAPYRITQVKLSKEGDGVRPEIQVVPSRVEAFGDTVSTSEDS